MLSIFCASLVLAATPAPSSPKAGHYYRASFADAVASGRFDPYTYTAHREPSIRLTMPRATVDHGQATLSVELRTARARTVAAWESRASSGPWRPIVLEVVGADRIRTDLGGEVETWVRLPAAFEALAQRTKEEQARTQRHKLVGKYRAEDGAMLSLTSGFKLSRCLESCRSEARAWCVVHKRVSYVLRGESLEEVGPPEGLCPDAPAFEPKSGARRYLKL